MLVLLQIKIYTIYNLCPYVERFFFFHLYLSHYHPVTKWMHFWIFEKRILYAFFNIFLGKNLQIDVRHLCHVTFVVAPCELWDTYQQWSITVSYITSRRNQNLRSNFIETLFSIIPNPPYPVTQLLLPFLAYAACEGILTLMLLLINFTVRFTIVVHNSVVVSMPIKGAPCQCFFLLFLFCFCFFSPL